MSLKMVRVSPEQYRAFGEFLTSADQVDQREIAFSRTPAGVATSSR
jgi:hypothetical protein